MSRITSFSEWVLRQPLLWGGLACMGFYAAIRHGFGNEQIIRYADSHRVEHVTIALFFVGMAALLMRLFSMAGQFSAFHRELLEPIPPGGQPTTDAEGLIRGLATQPEVFQDSYLIRRLRDALQFVRRKDSADTLDEHLRHLEENDAIRMTSGYATVRIIVWAIPILGFLGTVIGITMAIAKLSPESLETSLTLVTSKLGLAFDTTALALSLSIVLMFVKFMAERLEDQLLAKVDVRVTDELVGRFQENGTSSDPNVTTIRRMSEQVIQAVETISSRQADLWKSVIDESHEQWAEVTAAAGSILETSLSTAMQESYEKQVDALNVGAQLHANQLADGAKEYAEELSKAANFHAETLNAGSKQHAEQLNAGAVDVTGRLRDGLEKLAELLVDALEVHGETLTRSEKELAQENRQHLSEVESALGEAMVLSADRQEGLIHQSEGMLQQMQAALAESTDATVQQQEHLLKQGDVLLRVINATGQVKQLEDSLNQNLSTLGRAHNFEETMMSLSAAIQLLSARLGHVAPQPANIEIQLEDSTSSAA